jgi:ankyrin repeat protein
LLLEVGAEPDLKGNDRRTPLSWAAEKGREPVVQQLLERVDVDTKDSGSRTPRRTGTRRW